MMPSPAPWVFGSLQVWPEDRKLVADGVTHRPGARAFDLLLLLVENRDRVVSKAEIFKRIWSGLVVEENNLTVQISALRKILGPDMLATFSGRADKGLPEIGFAHAKLNHKASQRSLLFFGYGKSGHCQAIYNFTYKA